MEVWIKEIVRLANLCCTPQVQQVKTQNDVYRIECGADIFYLKTYTKDWYGDNVADTGYHVNHEETAWSILLTEGLLAPEVVYQSTTCDNPLNRPFLMTRELPGKPLTELLNNASKGQFAALLQTVGSYLRRMHNITFSYPGYLDTKKGPTASPSPSVWQHRCWSAEQRQRDALTNLASDETYLSIITIEQMRERLSVMSERLAPAYQPPRYIHGDCHAHQFFLEQCNGKWQVTGVLDMEVSSAGDSGEDILKLCIELAQRFSYQTRWWISLFEGYGGEPNFDLFRLRLLGVASSEFWRPNRWGSQGTRETVLRHFMKAEDWWTLFSPVPGG